MNTPTINGQFQYDPSTFTFDNQVGAYLQRTIFLGFDVSTPAAPYRDMDVSLEMQVALANMFRQHCNPLGDVIGYEGRCVRRWIASEQHFGHGKAVIAFTYEGDPSGVTQDELDGISAIIEDYFDDLYS